MAEENVSKPDTQAPAAGAAQRAVLPPVQIASQYVKDLSFENPNAPASLQPGAGTPQVQVGVDVRTQQLSETSYEVVLNIRADAKSGDKQAFLVELAYGGVVAVGNVPKEAVAPVLLIEAPRLLFPFARAIIAEATRDGGFPPLMIQQIDFLDLFRRQMAQLRKAQPAAGTPVAEAKPTVN